MDQLVQCLTDDRYKGKLVAVVAGYVHDIDGLMEANPGLASRFPETVYFPNFSVDDCCQLLDISLKNGFSTELAPEAAAALRELLPPIVQVRHASSLRVPAVALFSTAIFVHSCVDATECTTSLRMYLSR